MRSRELTTALLRASSTAQDLFVAAKMSGKADLAAEAKRFGEVIAAAIRDAHATEVTS